MPVNVPVNVTVISKIILDRSIAFCFGVSSNLSQEKSPTVEIVPRKYLPKISTVGLFSCDRFEETPKQKVVDL